MADVVEHVDFMQRLLENLLTNDMHERWTAKQALAATLQYISGGHFEAAAAVEVVLLDEEYTSFQEPSAGRTRRSTPAFASPKGRTGTDAFSPLHSHWFKGRSTRDSASSVSTERASESPSD